MTNTPITISTRNGALPMELITFYGWCMAWIGPSMALDGTPLNDNVYRQLIQGHTVDHLVNLGTGNKGAKAGIRGRTFQVGNRDLHDQMIRLFPELISSEITIAAAHKARAAGSLEAGRRRMEPLLRSADVR